MGEGVPRASPRRASPHFSEPPPPLLLRMPHGLGFRVEDLGFGVWGLGFGVWSFVTRVSGFECGVSGFEFRGSGFGSRVSDDSRV